MRTSIRFTLVAACAVALTACGGGEKIGDKKDAAGVLLALSQGGPSGGVLNTLASAAVPAMEQTADCPEGGKAKLKLDMSFDGFEDKDPAGVEAEDGFTQKMGVKADFDGCGIQYDNPETEEVEKDTLTLDGSQEMQMEMAMNGQNMAILVAMKSKLDLSGVFSDSFESDVVMNMALTGSDESVSFKQSIDGFVNTAEEKFNFENETFEFSADAAGGFKASKNGENMDLGDLDQGKDGTDGTDGFPSDGDFGSDFGDPDFGS